MKFLFLHDPMLVCSKAGKESETMKFCHTLRVEFFPSWEKTVIDVENG